MCLKFSIIHVMCFSCAGTVGSMVTAIAEALGRHRSTIHREIRRNFYHDPFRDRWGQEYKGYFCASAQKYARDRCARRRLKLGAQAGSARPCDRQAARGLVAATSGVENANRRLGRCAPLPHRCELSSLPQWLENKPADQQKRVVAVQLDSINGRQPFGAAVLLGSRGPLGHRWTLQRITAVQGGGLRTVGIDLSHRPIPAPDFIPSIGSEP
ncbi:hypothetical protein [Azospirillum endophyticum]